MVYPFICSFKVPEPEEEFITPLRERLGLDQTQKGQSVLMIREAVRADHGNFTIQVENTHGVASASCIANVLGKKPVLIDFAWCHFNYFLCNNIRFAVPLMGQVLLLILRCVVEYSDFSSVFLCLQTNLVLRSTLLLMKSGTLQLYATGNLPRTMVAARFWTIFWRKKTTRMMKLAGSPSPPRWRATASLSPS